MLALDRPGTSAPVAPTTTEPAPTATAAPTPSTTSPAPDPSTGHADHAGRRSSRRRSRTASCCRTRASRRDDADVTDWSTEPRRRSRSRRATTRRTRGPERRAHRRAARSGRRGPEFSLRVRPAGVRGRRRRGALGLAHRDIATACIGGRPTERLDDHGGRGPARRRGARASLWVDGYRAAGRDDPATFGPRWHLHARDADRDRRRRVQGYGELAPALDGPDPEVVASTCVAARRARAPALRLHRGGLLSGRGPGPGGARDPAVRWAAARGRATTGRTR